MFTNNYHKIIAAVLSGGALAPIVKYNGSSMEYAGGVLIPLGISRMMAEYRTSYTAGQGVVFGDGTTAPTADDYKLSGNIITGLTKNSCTLTIGYDDDGCYVTAVYLLANNGSADITIGEIGYMLYSLTTNTASGSSSSTNVYCMIDRTVLDSPLTIPAGGVGQVTYTIRMNYPTT